MTEKRRHFRRPADGHTYLFWTDAEGRFWQEKATVTDMSSGGLNVTLRNKIPERTQVCVRSAPGSVPVTAWVRHVRQKGLLYFTGLELPTRESHRRE